MPNVFTYGRVSTVRQAERGDSLDAQEAEMLRVYDYEYKPKGYGLGASVRDAAESGGKPLLNRPNGMRLNTMIEAGDVVIFAKLDRGFRDTRDALNTVDNWTHRGVIVRMLDLKLDTSDHFGKLLLTVMSAFAEFERQRIRERQKDFWRHRRKRRREGDKTAIASPKPPYGFMVVTRRGRKWWEVNQEQRNLGAAVVRWHDEKHMSFEQILRHLQANQIGYHDGKGRLIIWKHRNRIIDNYHAEKRLRCQETALSANSTLKEPTSDSM